jgi:dTDP-4-dehydrorhamnose 3,5-epimerase-like enzyme
MTKTLRVIPTKDSNGYTNGRLLPIWHVDDGPAISQVYLTTILPGRQKGPHLHKKRSGAFTVLTGNVVIVTRNIEGIYTEHECFTPDAKFHTTVYVPPGVPAALYNVGVTEALVLNMPHPAWRIDDQDEWPVEDWAGLSVLSSLPGHV